MKMTSNFKFNNIFFVGIGGISMSGLCKISHNLGAKVSGSDISYNEEIAKLRALNIKVFSTHSKSNINKDIDLVVYSGAINNQNPEILEAKRLGIKCMERSQFLGIISRLFDSTIAISGTHGKTTTTSMIGTILESAGYKPTIHLGGESINLADNTIIGDNKYFVVEACEYRESFRFLKPEILVVTNIEADHLDYYKDIKDITRAFVRLNKKSKFLIRNDTVEVKSSKEYVIGKDFRISREVFENNGYTFDVYFHDSYFYTFRLNMIGHHNVINALCAIAVCYKLGVDREVIRAGLDKYAGVKRRYERIGLTNTTPIIIDYAHHPTEIANSIKGIEEVYSNILYIFQPHTYSRTITLISDFVDVLQERDLLLYKTYPAREKEIVGGRAIDLFDNIMDRNLYKGSTKLLEYVEDIDVLRSRIDNLILSNNFDCVLILGAGDLAEKMRKYYK